jgi:hypothetical protein
MFRAKEEFFGAFGGDIWYVYEMTPGSNSSSDTSGMGQSRVAGAKLSVTGVAGLDVEGVKVGELQ